jgi:transcription initiation factor IIF auxiliary subunit
MIKLISQTIMTPYFVPETAWGELGIKTVCVKVFFAGIYGEYS